jgi:hypothetical protein
VSFERCVEICRRLAEFNLRPAERTQIVIDGHGAAPIEDVEPDD